MLAKLAGSALVMGATSLAGWKVAAGYAARPRQLAALQTALAILQTQVEYGAVPLPEALQAAAGAAAGPAAEMLRRCAALLAAGGGCTAGEALRGAVTEVGGRSALAADDLQIMLALAPVLGATGRADQIRHLTLARERLAAAERRAGDERDRYEKTARYLGVLSGAALVLIFL